MRKEFFIKNADGSITDTFNMDAHRQRYGVAKMVRKITCGAGKFAMAHIPGPHIANDAVQRHRQLLCNGCPEQVAANRSTEKCRACGCYLREKRKLIKEKCPNGLW